MQLIDECGIGTFRLAQTEIANVRKLVQALTSKETKPVDKSLASDESMARGVKLLKQFCRKDVCL